MKLPLIYTPKQLLDMCSRALISANEKQLEALQIRKQMPNLWKRGDDTPVRLLESMREEADDLESRAASSLEVALEYADDLIGAVATLTGIAYFDCTKHVSNYGIKWSERVTYQLHLDNAKHTIRRYELIGGTSQNNNKIVFYFNNEGRERYFQFPLNYENELIIEF